MFGFRVGLAFFGYLKEGFAKEMRGVGRLFVDLFE